MTRSEAKQEIRGRFREYLKPAKKKNTYICPLCNNGVGADGDGMTIDPKGDGLHLHCFKCGFHGDIVELYQQEHHTDAAGAFQGLYEFFHIDIENDTTQEPPQRQQEPKKAAVADNPATTTEGSRRDYNGYYIAMRKNLSMPAAAAYLSFRGLSLETAQKFYLGYDPAWRSPAAVQNGKNPPESPRLIIPTGKYSYVARDTRQDADKKWAKMKEGGSELFNPAALYNEDDTPVFITEGEIDALSVIEIGGQAVGLGSTGNKRKLLEALKEKRTGNILILCLDKDEAGRKAEDEIAEGLQELNISYIRADIAGDKKDPNEALTADKEAFTAAVQKALKGTAARPDSVADYINSLMAGEISKFKEGANRLTGYKNLDREAGGIYPGLYVLGAVSSLGKTTFIHQMGDQMAAAGEHILYFSLEQSRLEMVSKSLARMTAQADIKKAVSSLQIRAGNLPENVLTAADKYTAEIGERVSVIEGNFNCTVSFIGEYVSNYMRRNKVKPVVIVDYLQIIQAAGQGSTKEAVDMNVTELKRLSRSKDIPIFLISSLNRANYLTPVDFESFKESGGIEYTADVIWGLQLAVMNDDIFNQEKKLKDKREKVRQAKASTPRQIELVCLKNRYGISSYTVNFEYYPQFDLFMEAAAKEPGERRYR